MDEYDEFLDQQWSIDPTCVQQFSFDQIDQLSLPNSNTALASITHSDAAENSKVLVSLQDFLRSEEINSELASIANSGLRTRVAEDKIKLKICLNNATDIRIVTNLRSLKVT